MSRYPSHPRSTVSIVGLFDPSRTAFHNRLR